MIGRGKATVLGAAKKAMSRRSKARLQFLVGRIDGLLKASKCANMFGISVPVYLAAVLEYLAAEQLR